MNSGVRFHAWTFLTSLLVRIHQKLKVSLCHSILGVFISNSFVIVFVPIYLIGAFVFVMFVSKFELEFPDLNEIFLWLTEQH